MIPETSVDWKAFEYKYSDNPQRAFENLTYYLFCNEYNQKNGIFRYFNQPFIETNPIQVGDEYIGFQSKYYSDSVSMSSKEAELKEAVKGAARAYYGITKLYFYISHEFSPSSKKDIVKPTYQLNIEKTAQELGIKIEWRGKSNIEAQLMQDKKLTICRNVFFQVDSAVQSCCENLDKHKNDIFDHINTNVAYKDNTIVLEHNKYNLDAFLNGDSRILIVDGDAGSGKSALIKQEIINLGDDTIVFAFKSTDLDVDNKLKLLNIYGTLTIDEVMDVYKEAGNRILYIDAVEKYFVIDNQDIFEEIIGIFIKADWKIVLTIRTAYKESFQNIFLNTVKVQHYQVSHISHDTLSELSNTYGFMLPKDKKLIDFLCVPFYLGLYLSLDNLEDEKMLTLNKESFEEKIWEDIIRNNKSRKNNMPTRREETLTFITLEMLRSESYYYVIRTTDDHEALSGLEQSGVLIQTNDTRRYSHSHDVFEELVVNHIFTEQYKNNIEIDDFFAQFRTSLRIRRLFRGWLSDFASTKDHQDIIFNILDGKNVDNIWKDEVILIVISTQDLQDVYYKIISKMPDNNYEGLKRIAFLINTCCRVVDHTEIYLNKGNLFPFRISKPSGYAWEALLVFIHDNKDYICWDKELILVIIDVLNSWTRHFENIQTNNTRFAGEIGLFLLEIIFNDKNMRYFLRDEQIDKLQDVVLNSAWMIKEQLCDIFKTVIEGMKIDEEDIAFPYEISYNRRNANTPKLYVELAERVVSDIYHYGMVPCAMPELTISLMEKMWIRPAGTPYYYSHETDNDFGLNDHLSYDYYPVSAYKTPVISLLKSSQSSTTDFLIHFFNKTGNSYANSHLNADYGECYKIIIHVEDEHIEQVASDRLWKLHRGTHVGPNLIISLLMGFEQWLFDVVKNTENEVVVDYCRYILKKSENVMLTAVIVSIAEAYPEKMFDVVCDLLKTKEIFHLDSSRLVSEHSASFLLFGNNLFEKTRLESNKLPHRRIRLEEVILGYQKYNEDISEEDFMVRNKKLYNAIDDATIDMDKWSTSDKYAYYRMDLRHYQEVINIQSDCMGNDIYTVMPDYSEDMKELSKQSQLAHDNNLKYIDLQLWSDYKFNGNDKFKQYEKYSDVSIVCRDLRELWDFLNSDSSIVNDEFIDILLIRRRYISIASYTSAVILRDYREDIKKKDQELCEFIILTLGYMFTQESQFEISQAGNGVEAITVGLVLLINDKNSKKVSNENPLYILLKLTFKDWSHDSRIAEQIKRTFWKHSKRDGWRFIYLFSLFADQYEEEIVRTKGISTDTFFENNKKKVVQAMKKESVGIKDIDFANLSNMTIFTIISFVAAYIDEAYIIAEATKSNIMRITFADKESIGKERKDYFGYTLNYVVWFADVLLYCNDEKRDALVNYFLECTDIDIEGNDNAEDLLKLLIQEQDVHGKIDEFWKVWELLKPRMIELSKKKEQSYYSRTNFPIGKDKVIISYLFANSQWRADVHRCDLLSEERADFFDDFIDKAGSIKAELYALSKLLNSVGMDTYKEIGIEWIYKLVEKDPECNIMLYDNTLFYLEEYIGGFVARRRMDFRTNIILAQKTQDILEYMVNQGSQLAFFVREQI